MLKKKILVSVISDLVTDQRVQKECNTLNKIGYDVLLIGRKSELSFGLNELPFKTIRFYNIFKRGPLMYLVFNIQLFFYLLYKTGDVLWSNDLDTLLPNYLVSRIKKSILIYDSHEYFTESVYKKTSRKFWLWLEEKIFPHLKNVITVNDSIKSIYENKYGVAITVLRNVSSSIEYNSQPDLVLPTGKKILIIQGMGINENRGAEEAVLTMPHLPDEFVLYFVGGGTVFQKIKELVAQLKLDTRVIFINALPYAQMMEYTKQSYLGLVLEKVESSDEHRLALPNKLFDYIHAGVPVLSTEVVEIKSIIDQYDIGFCINNSEPASIAANIVNISENENTYNRWKANTYMAANEFNWEKEEKILLDFMDRIR